MGDIAPLPHCDIWRFFLFLPADKVVVIMVDKHWGYF